MPWLPCIHSLTHRSAGWFTWGSRQSGACCNLRRGYSCSWNPENYTRGEHYIFAALLQSHLLLAARISSSLRLPPLSYPSPQLMVITPTSLFRTILFICHSFSGFLMLRLFTLWDQRKSAKIILFVAFGATYTVAVVMSVLTLRVIFGQYLLKLHHLTYRSSNARYQLQRTTIRPSRRA